MDHHLPVNTMMIRLSGAIAASFGAFKISAAGLLKMTLNIHETNSDNDTAKNKKEFNRY